MYNNTTAVETPQQPNLAIAPLGRRLMAMLYDTLLLAAILLCTTAIYTITVVSITGDFSQHANVNTNDTLYELNPIKLGWPIFPVLASVYIGFFLYFWKNTGQTLGMLVWKIKLVTDQQTKITLTQGIIRISAATLSFSAFGLGYIALLLGDKKRTWHDSLSKSMVIRVVNDQN